MREVETIMKIKKRTINVLSLFFLAWSERSTETRHKRDWKRNKTKLNKLMWNVFPVDLLCSAFARKTQIFISIVRKQTFYSVSGRPSWAVSAVWVTTSKKRTTAAKSLFKLISLVNCFDMASSFMYLRTTQLVIELQRRSRANKSLDASKTN